MYYKLGRAGRALDRFGVIEFATTIAPGVRDVLLTGKVYEAVQRNAATRRPARYDAVVLDAPPTGRITQFLNVNGELAGLAKVGPIKTQADTVMTLFRSPRPPCTSSPCSRRCRCRRPPTGSPSCASASCPVGGVIVNQVRPRDLAPGRPRGRPHRHARREHDRRRPQGGQGRRRRTSWSTRWSPRPATTPSAEPSRTRSAPSSHGLDVPTYELPRLAGGVDLGGLYELAANLKDQGLA